MNMMSSIQRTVWISVMFCWSMMNGPWMVNGDLSCYSGSVDIVNGELNVASTSSIDFQQCSEPPSPPTALQPPSPTTKVNSTVPTATTQSDTKVAPHYSTVSGNETTPMPITVTAAASSTTPSITPQLASNTSIGATNKTTSATSGATNETTTATPRATNGTTTATSRATNETVPGTRNETAPGATNETTHTTPGATPGATPAAGSSVVGCVVTKSYKGSSKNNLTASFSCPSPAPDSPCIGIGFNGSTGEDNQTQCCVGALCNTLDSFIMKEKIKYSTVDSCFVGTTDAAKTQCGDSSNMCLTITETVQDGNVSYYCGNNTLQSYCEMDGALREGSFKQEDKNITVHCCGTTNCNTPIPPSTPATPPMATSPSTASTPSVATPPSTAAPPSTGTSSPKDTPSPPATSSATATPSSSTAMSESTATPPSTGAPQTSSEPSAPAVHSNKTLIIGIVAAFVVGLLGGVIVTVICCRRRNSSAARPGELLAFDSFHYKRMGADEVNEEVFMS